MVATSAWPTAHTPVDKAAVEEYRQLQNIVSEVRIVSADLAKGKLDLTYLNDPLIQKHSELIAHLANLKAVRRVEKGSGLRLALAAHEAWLDIDEQTLQQHRSKLEERLGAVREQIARLNVRLSNKNYVKNAPVAVVAQTKKQIEEQKALEARLVHELSID